MGFYDREYARPQRPVLWEPGRIEVTTALVIAHAAVYLVQLVTTDRVRPRAFTEWLMLDIGGLQHGEIWRLVTAILVHDPYNWLNLAWNLLLLWFFGRPVEGIYGKGRFLLFYLLAGLVGNLAWWWVNCWQLYPPVLFGAAPAITAVLVLCTLHYPRQTVLLFFVLPVPLWLITLLYVGKDVVTVLQQLGGLGQPGLAVVHVAGAAFAGGYYWWSGRSWRLADLLAFRRASRTASPSASSAECLEAEVDAILDKLNRHGKDSLTPQEWEILHRASEAYRRRR